MEGLELNYNINLDEMLLKYLQANGLLNRQRIRERLGRDFIG
jgi:hypothetical protein